MDIEKIFTQTLNSAFEVHKALGPGLLENTYRECLAYELKQRNLKVETEKSLPVVYKKIQLECGYRIDILVENKVIIELKAVEKLNDIHLAQIMSYMKLSDIKLGLLVNFNTHYLKNGIKRVALNHHQ
ncbi:MAG: GxxExxY protein [Tindallia sp. MSAO_Bac2]|nr:MAG: GxxExxY protein [Tindallia sp. MSAO_Bac2]